jgi:hypothetical protein
MGSFSITGPGPKFFTKFTPAVSNDFGALNAMLFSILCLPAFI